jgi:subtilisin family serine protease
VDSLLREFRNTPGVEFVEPNFTGSLCYTPSDPLWAQQSGDLGLIGMPAAWQAQIDGGGSAGASSSILVAVIDSGVEPTHPELSAALDAPNSFNFVENNTNVYDDIGHGTRVAGIIAARQGNAEGIAGVAFGCRFLSLDVADSSGVLTSARVQSAINHAVSHGARIVNMSFRLGGYSQAVKDACDAADSAGVMLIAAAGNENQGDYKVYPASYDPVLGVAALMDDGTSRALWSNYNGAQRDLVDLAAPGLTVFTTIPGWQYNGILGSGTSFAAPMVSGVAALLMTENPSQSTRAIRYHLTDTAQPLGNRPAWEPAGWAGAGRLDAANAMATPMQPDLSIAQVVVDDPTTLSASNNGDGVLNPGESVRLVVRLANARADATSISAVLSTTDTLVSLDVASSGWGNIASGGSAGPATSFAITLASTSPAHRVPLLASVSSDSGAYSVGLPFQVQVERPIGVPGGSFFTPQVWTADNTYAVLGNVTFVAGLSIQPGTVVRIPPTANFEVAGGVLSAIGTDDLPVTFKSLAPLPAVPWGRLLIGPGVSDATMENCIVQGGTGVRNEAASAHFSKCGFVDNAAGGLLSLAGSSVVTTCSASRNGGGGILAGNRPLKGCHASSNGGNGLVGAVVTGSSADNNGGVGITGSGASDCSATSNVLGGISVTGPGPVIRCRAEENGANGIAATDGVEESFVFRNGGVGIANAGPAGVWNCRSLQNDATGVATSGALVGDCTVSGNSGAGIIGSAATQVDNSLVSDNKGAPFVNVAQVTGCRVVRNGGPVADAASVASSYVAENTIGGISGGAIMSSTVIGNHGTGSVGASGFQNGWLMFNDGAGADAPAGSVLFSSIRENGGVGVRNVPAPSAGAVTSCNLHGNAAYEYYDDRQDASTTNSKNLRSNFWGTTATAEMAANPFPAGNIAGIYDKHDSGFSNGWYADYSGFAGSEIPAAPGMAAPAFLIHVEPNLDRVATVGLTTFTLTFSKPMDASVNPTATFGLDSPFTENVVNPAPGWVAGTSWRGLYWIQAATGSGVHTIRVGSARDAGGFEIPDDTIHRFQVDAETTGNLSANNGLAIAIGTSSMSCSWGESGKPDGAQGYNIHRSPTGEGGSYQKVNGSILTSAQFSDSGLSSGTVYYYTIDIIDSESNATQWTPPFAGVTQSASAVGDWELY